MEFIGSFLKRVATSYIETSVDLLKVEAAIAYLKAVKGVRQIFILLCLLVLFTVMLACAFLLIPIALLLFLPWAPETKAIVAICVGGGYVIIPLIVMLLLFSQRRWMKLTRANEVVRKAVRSE